MAVLRQSGAQFKLCITFLYYDSAVFQSYAMCYLPKTQRNLPNKTLYNTLWCIAIFWHNTWIICHNWGKVGIYFWLNLNRIHNSLFLGHHIPYSIFGMIFINLHDFKIFSLWANTISIITSVRACIIFIILSKMMLRLSIAIFLRLSQSII